jgi:CRP/FNR family transcriptional regulator, cyclic AMP receptor protein
LPSHADMLREVPLFALLDDQERATLAERIDVVNISKGSVIYRYGEPGGSMYVVRAGLVEMSFANDTGDKIILECARPGDFFGETSLLDGGPRTATAVVLEDMEALVVDRGDLDELFRLKPQSALDLLTATGKHLRETTLLLRHTASRDLNADEEDRRTRVMKVADWISKFSGSISFLVIHLVIFFVWIILNVKPLDHILSFAGFDPYPFGLLTMVVSLEAIVLSVFVLLSQNRQAERDRRRNDVEFDVNLKAELQIAHMHLKVDEQHAEVLARLERIEKLNAPPR